MLICLKIRKSPDLCGAPCMSLNPVAIQYSILYKTVFYFQAAKVLFCLLNYLYNYLYNNFSKQCYRNMFIVSNYIPSLCLFVCLSVPSKATATYLVYVDIFLHYVCTKQCFQSHTLRNNGYTPTATCLVYQLYTLTMSVCLSDCTVTATCLL